MISPAHAENKVTPIRDTSGQDQPLDPGPQRARRNKIILASVVCGLLVCIAALFTIRNWIGADVSISRDRVRVAEVMRGTFVRDVSAQGVVIAAVSPTLFAPATGSIHFTVQAGDKVTRHQEIAQLDSPELENELLREQATLASVAIAVQRQSIETRRELLANQQTIDLANVSIQAAEREQRRAADSWSKHLISERDFEKARDDAVAAGVVHKHAIAAAQLQKESLEFELRAKQLERDRQRLVAEDLQRRVADLSIKSPVDGVVGTLIVAERTTVPQNAALLSVVDLGAFEIEFQVPETYADDLSLGMDAEITYGAEKFAATVSAVSPEVKAGQVSGRLRFADAIPQGMRQNQRVATRIVLESRHDVLKVARGPFLDSGGGSIAYVVDGDVAARRRIRTGGTSVVDVEVVEGLAAGDRIIISNLSEFERIERVRLE